MKILLCCKAGVTSNMFASALKDEAKKKDLEIIIWAAAETAIEYSIAQADIVLVTPQLRSSLPKFEDLASPGVPVILIDDEDFQTFNAKKFLKKLFNHDYKIHYVVDFIIMPFILIFDNTVYLYNQFKKDRKSCHLLFFSILIKNYNIFYQQEIILLLFFWQLFELQKQ